MTLLYYITIICLNLTLIYVITFQHVYGRKMKDTHFQFRRHSFLTFFSILVSATISDLFIVDNGRIEILPLFTICLYYSAFVTFVLLASAYYGRMHYRNPFNWFFLLQYPLILIIFYFIMRLSHRYRQIYQWASLGWGLSYYLISSCSENSSRHTYIGGNIGENMSRSWRVSRQVVSISTWPPISRYSSFLRLLTYYPIFGFTVCATSC